MPFFPNRKVKLLDIQAVAANGTATINVPKGPRYKVIFLEFQNTDKGDAHGPGTGAAGFSAGDITITVAGNVVRRATAAQIDLLNQVQGSKYASLSVDGAGNGLGITRLPIFFEQPWRKRADYQNGLALETGWMSTAQSFQIKVPIIAGITPVLSAWAVVDDFSSGKANAIEMWDTDDINTNGATPSKSDLFVGMAPSYLVEQINLFDTNDNHTVTSAKLTINSVVIHEDVSRDESDLLHTVYDMYVNTLAGIYCITFDHDDLFESLRQVSSISQSQLQITLAAASAGTLRRIIQSIGVPGATN